MQFTPYTPVAISSFLIPLSLIAVLWARREERLVQAFLALLMAICVWALSSLLELTVTSLEGKIFFSSSAYLGIATVPTLLLLFVLVYTGREAWLKRRRLRLLAIMPLLTLIAVMSNPWHQQYWTQVTMDYSDYAVGLFERGYLFLPHLIYSYVLLFLSSLLLIRSFLRAPHLYRGQIRFILLGIFAPWLANAIYILGLQIVPQYFDLTPLAFAMTGLCLGWALYRFRLLDIIPIARASIVEKMQDAVLVFDKRNRIVDANPVALGLLQLDAEAVIGKAAGDVLSAYHNLMDTYATTEQAEAEISIPIGETQRYYKMRIAPLHTRSQELAGRVVVLHDITELKETNQQLRIARDAAEASSQLKSQFLATMSHELRTPLSAILGYAQLQIAGVGGELNPIQAKHTDRILKNAQHLLQMINDMLDISKIEAGEFDLAKEALDLAAWQSDLQKHLAESAQAKGLTTSVSLDPTLAQQILGDEYRLHQIALHLISNAVKFTEQGSIDIFIEKKSATLWAFRVRDTGIGIPEDKKDLIFQDFQQVDSSLTRKYEGVGLGLALVKRLVLLMGGYIQVNTSLAVGSEFSVTLPLELPPVAENAPLAAVTNTPNPS